MSGHVSQSGSWRLLPDILLPPPPNSTPSADGGAGGVAGWVCAAILSITLPSISITAQVL